MILFLNINILVKNLIVYNDEQQEFNLSDYDGIKYLEKIDMEFVLL